jgi:hypothetical protein
MAILSARRVRAFLRASAAAAPLLLLICTAGETAAQTAEDAVKAAFLYNFTRYIEWPAAALGPEATFHVCAAAQPAMAAEIEAMLRGEEVQGRPVRLLTHPTGDGTLPCHVFYFGATAGEHADGALASLKGAPVLTVGEGPSFIDRGGMITFVLENDRVKFDINKTAIDRAGLAVSSKLLRVARHVRTDGQP